MPWRQTKQTMSSVALPPSTRPRARQAPQAALDPAQPSPTQLGLMPNRHDPVVRHDCGWMRDCNVARRTVGYCHEVDACMSDGYIGDGYIDDGYIGDGYIGDGYIGDGYIGDGYIGAVVIRPHS